MNSTAKRVLELALVADLPKKIPMDATLHALPGWTAHWPGKNTNGQEQDWYSFLTERSA